MAGSSDPADDFSFNDISHHGPSEADPTTTAQQSSNDVTPTADDQAPKVKRIACILCRKRKLRCDGARPTCGTCKRLKHDCAYDEVRRKSGPKRGYVKQLEARLQQVETLLKNQEATDQARDSSRTSPSFSSGPSRQTLSETQTPSIHIGNSDTIPHIFQPSDGISPGEPFMGTGGASEGIGDEPFPWEMIGLGLDEPLPPQDEINELNQLYFTKIHPSLPLIHRPRYYAAMNLAPFMRPPVCLRYALWALAASVSEKYEALHEHFYQRARKYMQIDEMRGHGESMITLGHCQAWVLICTYEFKQMFFPRAWVSAGRAVRLSQMMMLHRLDGTGLDVKQCLPPPKDWTEREERRRTFWSCFCVDRYASIGTGWPMTIEEKDILTNLPAHEEAFDKSKPMPTSTLEEATTAHGVTKISSFGGVCLMASCLGRNLTHLHRPTPNDREDDLNGEFWKRHRQMDSVLLNTVLSLPDELRMPMAMSDANAIFLQMCLHTSAICLHQAAIYKSDKHRLPVTVTNESKIRCMNAASEIASLMRMISHLDLAAMNPFISFSIYVAARVFVQWLKNRPKDQQVLSSLQFLLQAMHALKKKNPLTESFMVQLDVDLEGIGIPGLRTGLDLTNSTVSMNLHQDNVACGSIYEIRESQNPLSTVNGTVPTFGIRNLTVPSNTPPNNSVASGTPFRSTTAALNLGVQDTPPFGYIQDGGSAQHVPSNHVTPHLRDQASGHQGEALPPKAMRSIVIPILDSTDSSEMDMSPDTNGDQPTPSSTGHRGSSSNTSFSPPGAQDEGKSPNIQQQQPHNQPGTVPVTSTTNSQQGYFDPTDDEFATLAQFYPDSSLNMHIPTSSTGGAFSLAVPSEWDTGGPNVVNTDMSSLSATTWGQMLDVTSMGWEGVPQHDPPWTTRP